MNFYSFLLVLLCITSNCYAMNNNTIVEKISNFFYKKPTTYRFTSDQLVRRLNPEDLHIPTTSALELIDEHGNPAQAHAKPVGRRSRLVRRAQ